MDKRHITPMNAPKSQLEAALRCYRSAAFDWSRSQLQFCLDDAQEWAARALRYGATEEQLDEIWYAYN